MQKVALSEDVQFTDAVSVGKLADVSISETLGLDDETIKNSAIGISETMELTDSLVKSMSVGISESLQLVDSVSRGLTVGISESLQLVDSTHLQTSIRITESLNMNEALNFIEISESLSIGDSLSSSSKIAVKPQPQTEATPTGTPSAGAGGQEPYLKIWEVKANTCDETLEILVGPKIPGVNVSIHTELDSYTAQKAYLQPLTGKWVYTAPLMVDSGSIKIGASAYAGQSVIYAESSNVIINECNPITYAIELFEKGLEAEGIGTRGVVKQPNEETTGLPGFIDPVLIQFVTILFLLMLGILYYSSLIRNSRREEEKPVIVSGKTILVEPEEKKVPTIIPPLLKEERKPEISELLEILSEQQVTEQKLRLLERQLSEILSEEIQTKGELILVLEIILFRIRPQLPALEFFKPKKRLTPGHKAKDCSKKRKEEDREEKAKIAVSMKGRKMSEEHKAKIASCKKRKEEDRGRKGKDCSFNEG